MQERDWSGFSPKLSPVLFAAPGGWFLVMPRVEPLTDDQWEQLDEEAYEHLRQSVKDAYLPVEHKRSTFGTLNGQLVAVDYGS